MAPQDVHNADRHNADRHNADRHNADRHNADRHNADAPNGDTDPFAALATIVLGEEPLADILERVVHLASQVLPGNIEASITLVAGEEPSTAAFTGPVALALDERQYENDRGPCLDAAAAGELIMIGEMATDERWPSFAKDATGRGINSSLSVPLPVQRNLTGALNFYSTSPHGFDPETIDLAQTFAGHAAVAVANAHLYEATLALAEQMKVAMASRAVIEQAKGIIMRDRGCRAEEAFDVLVRMSQQTHVKLREVAQRLVDETLTGDQH